MHYSLIGLRCLQDGKLNGYRGSNSRIMHGNCIMQITIRKSDRSYLSQFSRKKNFSKNKENLTKSDPKLIRSFHLQNNLYSRMSRFHPLPLIGSAGSADGTDPYWHFDFPTVVKENGNATHVEFRRVFFYSHSQSNVSLI